ncbi:MAG TPA: DUF4124 domain-containing protein [Steroidobacteraceae bacterium]|nr:DUF4124 domain-containing protein [Steroidobacteraceae bacterium]
MKRVLLCALLLGWSAMASAVVYKWVDAQGKLQYGDNPPDGVHAEVVELLGVHNTRSTSASPSSSPSAPKPASPDPTDKDREKAVSSDVAQTREKQCAEAQERYKKLIEGRRLYKTGENGERQYLTSEEIDSERLNAKRDVDETCNSAT